MCDAKLSYDLATALAKGVCCGILMFIAVDQYRKTKSYLATFICLPVFILAGFEHSIADMFYLSSAGYFTLASLTFIIVIIVGNAIGCALIPLYKKYIDNPKKEKTEIT